MKFTVTSPTSQFDLSNIKDVRIVLVKIINTIVQRDSWSQEEVAEVLKVNQPTVSRLKHLKISSFSLERIFLFLLRLNCDLNLVINRPEYITTIKVRSNIKNVRIDIMSYITSIIAKYQLTQVEAAEVMLINRVSRKGTYVQWESDPPG